MKKRSKRFKVVPFPKIRRVYSDQLREVQHKHIFHALVEVDVTRARQSLREHKARTGESLSFTPSLRPAWAGQSMSTNRSRP